MEELPAFDNAELIHRCTRADAIRDGVLIDVSATAREAGFKYPVALAAAAWAKCVVVPPGVLCQEEAAWLRGVVWLLACASAAATAAAERASAAASATTTGSADDPGADRAARELTVETRQTSDAFNGHRQVLVALRDATPILRKAARLLGGGSRPREVIRLDATSPKP